MHVLRDFLIVRERLLRNFGQRVSAIFEEHILLMAANLWAERDTFEDLALVQVMCEGIAVELVRTGDALRKVSVREMLDRLGLTGASCDLWDAVRFLPLSRVALHGVRPDNDPARVEIVAYYLSFPNEFRTENYPVGPVLHAHFRHWD
jgi:hypothetical protein